MKIPGQEKQDAGSGSAGSHKEDNTSLQNSATSLCQTSGATAHRSRQQEGARMSVIGNLGRYIFMRHLRTIFLYPVPFKIYEFKEIYRSIETNKEGLLVDIGCGRGLQTILVSRKYGKSIGIDIDPQEIDIAQTRLRRQENRRVCFRHSDLFGMKLGSDCVDLIVSFSVLEHIPNWRQVLVEAFRILKSGGRLLFSADCLGSINDAGLMRKHKRDYKVVQYFSVEQLGEALKDAGFHNVSVRTICKSQFAQRLFEKGINNDGFSCNRFLTPFLYFVLARSERMVEHKSIPGIFIIADAYK